MASDPEDTPTAPRDETLLDSEYALTTQFYDVLTTIFNKYQSLSLPSASPTPDVPLPEEEDEEDAPALSRAQLNRFAEDTNGQPMEDATFIEIAQFLSCVKDSDGQPALTHKGFIQLYQLQSENDPSETWSDLQSWGYDKSLKLVTTRKEGQAELDAEEGDKVAKELLTSPEGGELSAAKEEEEEEKVQEKKKEE